MVIDVIRVIEQSEDQLNEITRSGMKELHTAASQVKLYLLYVSVTWVLHVFL